MTAVDRLERRDAALIVEVALSTVFDPGLVRQLREDSPLSVLGMVPADAVCVADAVEQEAGRLGWVCRLGDDDLADAASVAELVTAVQERGER